jgi:hypothetical protein
MNSEFVCLRYKNKIYTTKKIFQESNDKAMSRIWYIATKSHENPNILEKELICMSHIYVNEKYMQMKY